MNKLKGWLLVCICSFFLVCFLITAVISFNFYLKNGDEITRVVDSFYSTIVYFVLFTGLFIYGIIRGIKHLKQTTRSPIISYNEHLNIEFKGQIEYKQYRNYLVGLSIKKPVYIIFLILSFTLLAIDPATFLDYNSPVMFVIVGFIIIPFITLYNIRKNFRSSSFLKEMITYNVTNDSLKIKGDTLDSEQKWSHFIEIKETKDFLLFYTARSIAIFIDKKLLSHTDLNEFKQFLHSLDIKKTLM